MSGRAGIIASMAKALSAISPASIAVISRDPGRFLWSLKAVSNIKARLLAYCVRPCNSRTDKIRGGDDEPRDDQPSCHARRRFVFGGRRLAQPRLARLGRRAAGRGLAVDPDPIADRRSRARR